MKTFMIHCSTTKSYWITVDAPSKEAAELWYDDCDAGEFLSGEEWGWRLSEIQELPLADPRLRACKLLNEAGEEA